MGKYKNLIVFEDQQLLFAQIANILKGRFSTQEILSEEDRREYDAFDDDYVIQATSVVTNKTKFNFDDMISATTEFVLDGTDGLFNPDNPSSIFFAYRY